MENPILDEIARYAADRFSEAHYDFTFSMGDYSATIEAKETNGRIITINIKSRDPQAEWDCIVAAAKQVLARLEQVKASNGPTATDIMDIKRMALELSNALKTMDSSLPFWPNGI